VNNSGLIQHRCESGGNKSLRQYKDGRLDSQEKKKSIDTRLHQNRAFRFFKAAKTS